MQRRDSQDPNPEAVTYSGGGGGAKAEKKRVCT